MISLLLHLLRLFPFLCGGHRQLALENLALRHQLAVYRRTAPRPKLHPTDRLFWVGLARVWTGWRSAVTGELADPRDAKTAAVARIPTAKNTRRGDAEAFCRRLARIIRER
jgi:hypothetical protein